MAGGTAKMSVRTPSCDPKIFLFSIFWAVPNLQNRHSTALYWRLGFWVKNSGTGRLSFTFYPKDYQHITMENR